MNPNEIVIVTDYHSKQTEFRWFDRHTGQQRTFDRPTEASAFTEVLDEARSAADPRGGGVTWIMESTTGWARMRKLLGEQATFHVVNVLQMPLPPKAYRRKTDKLDTQRVMREYLQGDLPLAHQPDLAWRSIRRLVGLRHDLVRRRTALRNRVTSYFAHETWEPRGFWSAAGMRRLRTLIDQQPDAIDRFTLTMQWRELRVLDKRLARVEREIRRFHRQSPEAQRLDAIDGVAEIAAVGILARIGPIDRFADAEQLIAYAGLAPGVRGSDQTLHHLSIGGGGPTRCCGSI